MRLKTTLTALSCGILLLAACHKDKDKNNNNSNPTTTTKTPTEYLTGGKWMITAMPGTYTLAGQTFHYDEWDSTEACSKDNTLTFLTSGTVVTDEGSVKCDPSDPQVDSSSKWTLINNDTKLLIKDNSSSTADTYNVSTINATSMRVWNSYEEMGVTASDTIVFKNVK